MGNRGMELSAGRGVETDWSCPMPPHLDTKKTKTTMRKKKRI